MERISKIVGGKTVSIRRNRYDNWYGYVGNRRVESFFGGPDHTQEESAREWFDAQGRLCEVFALCDNLATTTMEHPILGNVPSCERCKAKLDRM